MPLPLLTKVMPVGRAPVSPSDGAGKPVVVTRNVAGVPAWKPVAFALVIVGASLIVMLSVCCAVAPTPFEAFTTML